MHFQFGKIEVDDGDDDGDAEKSIIFNTLTTTDNKNRRLGGKLLYLHMFRNEIVQF